MAMQTADIPIDPALLELDQANEDDDDVLREIGESNNSSDSESEVSSSSSSSATSATSSEDEGAQGAPSSSRVVSRRKNYQTRVPQDPRRALAPKRITRRNQPRAANQQRNADGGGEEEEEDEAEEEEDETVLDRLAGYVTRAPREGSIAPGGGFFTAAALRKDKASEKGKARKESNRGKRIHKPTHEMGLLLSSSNMAFIQGDRAKAIEGYLEVIRTDPYIAAAWTALASCYEEEGNMEAARQMRFCGMHVEGDVDGWKELAEEYKSAGQNEECLYCLRKGLILDPQDVMALYDLAAIYQVSNQPYRALTAYRKILKLDLPSAHDFTFLKEIHDLAVSVNRFRYAADALRLAFDHHQSTLAGPSDRRAPNTMMIEHVIALADLCVRLDEFEDAVRVVRAGQRWLQGRSSQRFWDAMEDDREYDPSGYVRGGVQIEDDERNQLDFNLRYQLALARLQLGHDPEAYIHIDTLLRDLSVDEYPSIFLDLGRSLMKRQHWEKALECFGAVQQSTVMDDSPDMIYSMGICYHELADLKMAEQALEYVETNDPGNLEARLRLANVLEDLGRSGEALTKVSEVLRERAKLDGTGSKQRAERTKQSKAEQAASQRLTKRILEDQMRTSMKSMWEDVQDAERGITGGDMSALDRFTLAAGTMIENFRLARSNFGKHRGITRVNRSKYAQQTDIATQAQELQHRLERALGFEDDKPSDDVSGTKTVSIRQTEFYGLDCEEWLNLVVKYCCVLMAKNDEPTALDILEHIVWAGLFNNRRSEVAIRLCIITCAMRMKAHDKIADNCKRLTQMHQFRPEPLLLMMACLGGGGTKAFRAWEGVTLQKFIHRELRLYDQIVQGYDFHYSAPGGRWAVTQKYNIRTKQGSKSGAKEEDTVPATGAKAKAKKKLPKPKAKRKDDEDLDGEDEVRIENDDEVDEEEVDPEEEERAAAQVAAESAIPVRPTKHSPFFNAIYGVEMLNARSYQTAIFYFIRAYEYDQYNPLLCLMLAQAYLARSLVRQADNRNYFITQGLLFLTRYRKLSPTDAIALEEVEYNYGRAFHGIGVAYLAIAHYEKVLESVQRRMADSDEPDAVRQSSLACEAAHNLVLLYGSAGSVALVKERSKWLAI